MNNLDHFLFCGVGGTDHPFRLLFYKTVILFFTGVKLAPSCVSFVAACTVFDEDKKGSHWVPSQLILQIHC